MQGEVPFFTYMKKGTSHSHMRIYIMYGAYPLNWAYMYTKSNKPICGFLGDSSSAMTIIQRRESTIPAVKLLVLVLSI